MNKLILGTLALAFSASALADGHRYAPYPAVYGKECASCHLAYPPELMTAPGWKSVMAGLDKHFGSDASLDAATAKSISTFLEQRASRKDKHAPTEASGQITRTAWFVREHRLSPPKGTKFSDCGACHSQAAAGDFSERGLTVSKSSNRKER